MGTMFRSSFNEIMTSGIALVNTVIEDIKQDPEAYWTKFTFEGNMTGSKIQDIQMHGIPGVVPVKLEGGLYSTGVMGSGYKIEHTATSYGKKAIASREAVEDFQYNLPMRMRNSLVDMLNYTLNVLGHEEPNKWFTTNSFDGVPHFSTSHPINYGTAVLANCPTVPVDLSYQVLIDAGVAMDLFTNYIGRPYKAKTQQLLVNPTQKPTVSLLLKTDGEPDTSDHNINLIQEKYEPIFSPYVIDTNAWMLIPKVQDNPQHHICMWRVKPEIGKVEINRDTDNREIKLFFRVVFGTSSYEGSYGSPGT